MYRPRAFRVGLLAGLCVLGGGTAIGQSRTSEITVHVDKPGVKISPTFYGLMTEEINYSYDGGLYGELIQNRTFQDDATSPTHWSIASSNDSAATIDIDKTTG